VREIHLRELQRNHVDAALEHLANLSDGPEQLAMMVLADLEVHRAIVRDSGSSSLDDAFGSVMRELRLALAQTTFEYRDSSRIYRQHHKLVDDVWNLPLEQAQAKIREHNVEAIAQVQAAVTRA